MDKWWNHAPKQDVSSIDNWQKRQASYASQDQSLDPDAMKVASKQTELQSLLQQIYQAEAAVKMETGEVTRTQQVAAEAEQALEEATNKVRLLSSDLQAAQEAAAQAAMRAHTAQLQLSAHDQLMFTARQRVDALSAQMVSVQAELAAAQQLFTLTNSSQHLEAQARAGQIPFLDMDSAAAFPPEAFPPQPYLQDPNFAQRWPPPLPQVIPPYQSNLPSPDIGQRHQIPYLYS
ncbi:uncharacterized protein [Halyomorpha halys]|nr:uncharacterized protein LOC106679094 isoform X2 [Halyomorpha halys]